MGSTAALMAGLQSFDSSVGGITNNNQQQQQTFNNSLIQSFHSEDYDQSSIVSSSNNRILPSSNGLAPSATITTGAIDITRRPNSILIPNNQQHQQQSTSSASSSLTSPGGRLKPPPSPKPVRPPSRIRRPELESPNQQSQSQPTTPNPSSTQATSASFPFPTPQLMVQQPSQNQSQADLSVASTSNLSLGAGIAGGNQSKVLRELSNNKYDDRNSGSWQDGGAGGSGSGSGTKTRTKKSSNPESGTMSLRQQESLVDDLTKDNFNLKLKIHFYEKRLAESSPDHINDIFKENVQLKIDFESSRTELKRHRKLLREAEGAIKSLAEERDAALRGAKSTGGGVEMGRKERDEWERRVRDLEDELAESRKSGGGSDGFGETDGRAEISRLRAEVDAEREAKEDALGRQDDLEMELRQTNELLDDAVDENGQLRNDRRLGSDDRSGVSSSGGSRRDLDKLDRDLKDLETTNKSLVSQITVQTTMISARNSEKEILMTEVESLKNQIQQLDEELEQHDRVRARNEKNSNNGDSRSGNEDDRDRAELEAENDEYRDKISSHALQLEALENELADKEQEIEELLQDLELRDSDHANAIELVNEEWKGEVEEARNREAEATDILEEKGSLISELTADLKLLTQDLAQKESDLQAEIDEVELLTKELKQLGEKNFNLEADLEDREIAIQELEKNSDGLESDLNDKQALHEQVVTALKERLTTTNTRLSEITISYESSSTEAKFLREKVEELAIRTAELEESSRSELAARRSVEDEADALTIALRREEEERDLDSQEFSKQRREDQAKWDRMMEKKEKELQSTKSDIAKLQSLLSIRETDLQKLQDAMNGLTKLGETHTNNQFSLGLELERAKRDLARCQSELDARRREMDENDEEARERDSRMASLRAENKDLSTQLASQTQTRLTLSDKFDLSTKALRAAQSDLIAARDRLQSLENQLGSGRGNKNDIQLREQITERNTLLLTVYQYMDKFGAPRKAGQADPKPFTNFNIFSDNLISRLRAVSGAQGSFEKRAKEIESKFGDQITSLKRQLESRLRQLDKFEVSVKTATESHKLWKTRIQSKQTELDATKSTVNELQTHLSLLRSNRAPPSPNPESSGRIAALTTRAQKAESKIGAYQLQIEKAQIKLDDARTKIATSSEHWQARLNEAEARCRNAEERLKRERQGAKERVNELGGVVADLNHQVQAVQRRDAQIADDYRQNIRPSDHAR